VRYQPPLEKSKAFDDRTVQKIDLVQLMCSGFPAVLEASVLY
jgi:hypothetical protein